MGDSDFSIVSRQSADYSSNNIADQANAHLGNVYNHQRSVYNVNQIFNVNVQINGQNGEMSERFVRRFTNTAHTTDSREIECSTKNITGRALQIAARGSSQNGISSTPNDSDQKLRKADLTSRHPRNSPEAREYYSGSANYWTQSSRHDSIAMTRSDLYMYAGDVQQGPQTMSRRPQEYYCTGRVFATPGNEPGANITPALLRSQAEKIYMAEFRILWVVLKSDSGMRPSEANSYCLALKISTYGGQGVGKAGIMKANHGIIYSGTRSPEPRSHELPSRDEFGGGMVRSPIRVQMTSRSEQLDTMSRLDYGKTYYMSKSSPVYDVGMVHRDSIPALMGQFEQVQHRLATGGGRNTEDADNDSEASEDEQEEKT